MREDNKSADFSEHLHRAKRFFSELRMGQKIGHRKGNSSRSGEIQKPP